jgi:helicase
LTCFNNLFDFACEEAGKTYRLGLTFLITMLQYGFVQPQEIALKDAGLPDGVIEKLSSDLSECRSIKEIRLKLRLDPSIRDQLTEFERHLLDKIVGPAAPQPSS